MMLTSLTTVYPQQAAAFAGLLACGLTAHITLDGESIQETETVWLADEEAGYVLVERAGDDPETGWLTRLNGDVRLNILPAAQEMQLAA